MKLKLTKIPTKHFVFIFTIINIIAGFIFGAMVSFIALVSPSDDSFGPMEPWAILIFPILNGLLALASGAFFTALYNFLAKRFGGIDLEFEATE